MTGSPDFSISETPDDDGIVRVTVRGELDLAVVDQLRSCLERLRLARAPVRLDMSELSFIDSTGLQCLLMAVTASRESGTRLEIGQTLTAPVRRVIELIDAHRWLWGDQAGNAAA